MSTKYNVVDLFCGCGGLSLGFKLAGKEFQIKGAIDKSPFAVESYKYNFKNIDSESVISADIQKLSPSKFKKLTNIDEKIDVIIGGPPCPGFSHIGRSKIMNLIKIGKWADSKEIQHAFVDDPRNKLFNEYVKYVKYFKPKIFVFENVKGIGSSKIKIDGKTFHILDIIEKEFKKINYIVKRQLLNSADFGVPQHRERFFIVGLRNDLSDSFDFNFPKTSHSKPYLSKKDAQNIRKSMKRYFTNKLHNDLPHVTTMQAIIDIAHANHPSEILSIDEAVNKYIEKYEKYDFVRNKKSNKSMKKFLEYVRAKYDNILNNNNNFTCNKGRKPNEWAKKVFPKIINEPDEYKIYKDLDESEKIYKGNGFNDKLRRLPWWRAGYTIIAHLRSDGYMFIHPDTDINRTISVREAARLQSFPDMYDFSAGGKIKMNQQFWHIGNAVPPLLGKALGNSVLEWLKSKE